jgi:hypothetical protein
MYRIGMAKGNRVLDSAARIQALVVSLNPILHHSNQTATSNAKHRRLLFAEFKWATSNAPIAALDRALDACRDER